GESFVALQGAIKTKTKPPETANSDKNILPAILVCAIKRHPFFRIESRSHNQHLKWRLRFGKIGRASLGKGCKSRCDWSSNVCSSDLNILPAILVCAIKRHPFFRIESRSHNQHLKWRLRFG